MATRTIYKCNSSFILLPDRGVKTAAAYYGYATINPSSAATGYQKTDQITVHLYEDMSTGLLSLHIICDAYGGTTGGNAQITVSGLPTESTVSMSDDTGEAVKTNSTTAVGSFSWGAPNTDGFVIDNIQNFNTITITIGSYSGITHWNVCSYSGQYSTIPVTDTLTLTRVVETFDPTLLVTANPPPGVYSGSQNVILSYSSGLIVKESVVQAPSNAKVIAYDTLTPPNPFIAVVDDGRGRVVFDGGFPKFYNSSWNNATSYTQLSAAHAYMHNAINWVVNKDKVRLGNKKILVFNDGPSSYDYTTFNTTLDGIASIAGFTLTHKNRSNYGGAAAVDISYSELDSYAAVIVFSTETATAGGGITEATADRFKLYRESGNGIVIVTDHNVFQATANQIAAKFGALFSGDFNRSPVSVDYLKANYGVHPLWNNIKGSVYAGGSEGMVSVTEFPNYGGETISLVGDGIHNIYVLAEDEYGNFYSYVFSYLINVGDPIEASNVLTVKKVYPITFVPKKLSGQDVSGLTKKDGVVIGEFSTVGGTPSYNWYSSSNVNTAKIPVVIELALVSPVSYTEAVTITRYMANTENPLKLSSYFKASRGAELQNTWSSGSKNLNSISSLTAVARSLKVSKDVQGVSEYFKIV